MQITIELPTELRDLLAMDSNLSIAEINVIDKTVTIYDARTNRYDYSTHYGIEVTVCITNIEY